jgi:ribosomal protein S18 acetylase RimI-like enzyme
MLRVHIAHADAWEAHGRLREPYGGAALALPGIRVMAAGVPHPRFNSADVSSADCDLAAARAWYASRGVDWGARVPPDIPWPHGRHLMTQRMMELAAAGFRAAPSVAGLSLRAATAADLDLVAALDAEAFDGDPDEGRAWLAPLLGASAPATVIVALAHLGGEPAGAAYSLRTDSRAGPCLYLAGVGVIPAARRRGVAAAMSSWLLQQGFAAGAELAHLHPDTDQAARIYARLGFTEVAGLEIYVDP